MEVDLAGEPECMKQGLNSIQRHSQQTKKFPVHESFSKDGRVHVPECVESSKESEWYFYSIVGQKLFSISSTCRKSAL